MKIPDGYRVISVLLVYSLAIALRTPCVRKTFQSLHFSRYIDQNLWECVKVADLVGPQTANELILSFLNYSHYFMGPVFFETRCINYCIWLLQNILHGLVVTPTGTVFPL